MGTGRHLAAVVTLAVAACAPGNEAASTVARRPDVLLVVLDTVRADHLATYGYERRTDDRLGAVAEIGVTFEDVTASAPWTWPSHASIFTGQPPWVHGAHLSSEPDGVSRFGIGVTPLREDLPTLAERFAQHGYRTAALVVNDWLDPELGLLRGFEHVAHFDRDAALLGAVAAVVRRSDEPGSAASPRSADDPPLFLFVNLMTAHSPFRNGPGAWALDDPSFLDAKTAPEWLRPYLTRDAPAGVHLSQNADDAGPTGVVRYAAGDLAIPPEDMAQLMQLYDASVRGADFALGRVLETWIAADRDGIVAVTSDHGEAFGEHGMLDHRASVYPEVLRVPLVIAAPGRLPAGTRVKAPVSLQSLHDTLLDLADLETGLDSLVPLARGETRHDTIAAAAWRDPVWAAHAGGRFENGWRLFRRGDHALVYAPGSEAAELYDLSLDPRMEHDRSRDDPARVVTLRGAAERHFGRAPGATAALEIPAPVATRLRALGYAASEPH